ncbi:hypothetical protein V2S66_03195 [Streptomyces sp. V4-01]|uniref:Uncharacterized protein n=1 Tax=Actinacidiphila polyblastidii TaxID=3110430 RepID=A0ABU7P5Q6_9ACTN|nr:hypothetical protein [Streptomyces sp. V4-01]
MTATAELAAIHLQYVIDSWEHLTDMLDTRHGAPWPPAARMTDYLAGLKKAEATADEIAEAAAHLRAGRRLAERADSRFTLGESPAPIRLQVLDVIRTVEHDLVYLADTIAQEIQRPVMAKAPSNWLPADRKMRDKLVAEDAADPRRWRYRQYRTAPFAAVWLAARAEERPGPFLRPTSLQVQRIATGAAAAAAAVQRALDGVRQAQVVNRPCPLCGGTLGMASGDGEAPIVVCFACRQEWQLVSPSVA